MHQVISTHLNNNYYIFFLLLVLGVPSGLFAQESDSLQVDTILAEVDSLPGDSAQTFSRVRQKLPYKVSKDTFEAPISYQAKDSMWYDIVNQQVHLFGAAEVTYQELKLQAGYIIFDMKDNIVTAESFPDSTGKIAGKPTFFEKDQNFSAQKMRYNFKTRKGIVYQGRTFQEGLHIHSGITKLSMKGGEKEENEEDDVIYSSNSLFTTCDHDHPHYGIRSNKQKIIPDKIVVVGPSNLEIAGVPTPLWLPFGFFPISKGQSSGIIFPRDFERSESWGFGLENIGYYFALGQHFDLQLTGSIYTRGSWSANAFLRYKQRYRYNGSFRLGYSLRKTESPGLPNYSRNDSYIINWTHAQDSKAHPSQSFNANVNIQTNNFLSLNNDDARNVLANSLSSNITYRKSFPGKPFNLTTSFTHSQNTRTRDVTINFPRVDFNMRRIFPFERKNSTGKEAWYEKIGLDYQFQAQNEFQATDTTLFKRTTLENAQYGIRHQTSVNANYTILKYFTFTPSFSYTEKWFFKTAEKSYDPTLMIQYDTIYLGPDSSDFNLVPIDTTFGAVNDFTNNEFKALREFNTGASLRTRLYGTVNLPKGPLKAIRHVATPTVSYSFSPDYTNPVWGYFDSVRVVGPEEEYEQYSVFEGGVYSGPSSGGLSSSINFAIDNIFQAKVKSRRDTTGKNVKKINLFDNARVSTSYNMAADSLHWRPLNFTARTRFGKFTQMRINWQYSFYNINENNREIDQFYREATGKMLRFEHFRIGFNTDLGSQQLGKLFGVKPKTAQRNENQDGNQTEERQQPSGFFDFIGRTRFTHLIEFSYEPIDGRDTFRITSHNLSLRGFSINLTPNWRFSLDNIGYNFITNNLTYPSFALQRNLHCWQLEFNWQPQRGTFGFRIGVSNTPLDFINIPYNKRNYDPPDVF